MYYGRPLPPRGKRQVTLDDETLAKHNLKDTLKKEEEEKKDNDNDDSVKEIARKSKDAMFNEMVEENLRNREDSAGLMERTEASIATTAASERDGKK